MKSEKLEQKRIEAVEDARLSQQSIEFFIEHSGSVQSVINEVANRNFHLGRVSAFEELLQEFRGNP
jgi:hypothetical protein